MDAEVSGLWTGYSLDLAKLPVTRSAGGYSGFLGNGWGYALDAAVAALDRLIVNVLGNDSACFHIAELDTYARY